MGQTGRQLGLRKKEHRRAVDSGDCISSAIAEHAWGSRHPVDWDHIKVLDHHSCLHQRLVLELIHITSQPTLLNRDTGAMPQVYNQLFRNYDIIEAHCYSFRYIVINGFEHSRSKQERGSQKWNCSSCSWDSICMGLTGMEDKWRRWKQTIVGEEPLKSSKSRPAVRQWIWTVACSYLQYGTQF